MWYGAGINSVPAVHILVALCSVAPGGVWRRRAWSTNVMRRKAWFTNVMLGTGALMAPVVYQFF